MYIHANGEIVTESRYDTAVAYCWILSLKLGNVYSNGFFCQDERQVEEGEERATFITWFEALNFLGGFTNVS